VKKGPARQIGLRAHLGHGPPLQTSAKVYSQMVTTTQPPI